MGRSRKEADFAHSMTDLMSGVAVMFLVIAAIFMVQAAKARQRAHEARSQAEQEANERGEVAKKYEELEKREKGGEEELAWLKAKLEHISSVKTESPNPRLLTIIFTQDVLHFKENDCKVDAQALSSLRQTLLEIFPHICASVAHGLEKSITLEGHTDNKPPRDARCGVMPGRPGFENNVRLSAARAQYVFFQARDALRELQGDNLVETCLDRHFLVAGRGPSEPLDDLPWDARRSEEANKRNRRVVIKVRIDVGSVRAP